MNKDEERILDNGYEDVVVFKNPDFDGACVGVSEDNRAIYDFNLMVQSLSEEDGIEEIEAIEFIEANTIRSLPYIESQMGTCPIIMYPLMI